MLKGSFLSAPPCWFCILLHGTNTSSNIHAPRTNPWVTGLSDPKCRGWIMPAQPWWGQFGSLRIPARDGRLIHYLVGPIQVVWRVMVVVHLWLTTVVSTVPSVTLGALTVINHFFEIWVVWINLLLEIYSFAPDVWGRVFSDSTLNVE